MNRVGLVLGAVLGLAVWPGPPAAPPPPRAAAPAAAPFAVETHRYVGLVVVLDGRGVTPDTCREVARLLRPVRPAVCDARPPHMRPGDYVTVWVGPMDWLPGRSGWANVALGPATPRYTPQAVHAAAADPRVIAHEVGHALLGFGHSPAAGNLMHDPPGEAWTLDQRRRGWDAMSAYYQATPAQFRWRRPAVWVVEAAAE